MSNKFGHQVASLVQVYNCIGCKFHLHCHIAWDFPIAWHQLLLLLHYNFFFSALRHLWQSGFEWQRDDFDCRVCSNVPGPCQLTTNRDVFGFFSSESLFVKFVWIIFNCDFYIKQLWNRATGSNCLIFIFFIFFSSNETELRDPSMWGRSRTGPCPCQLWRGGDS